MIGVQELKNGATFVWEGQPFVVLKYEHIKMGRGSATIRVKVRNLVNGTVLEKTFVNSARVEEIETQRRVMQCLYASGEVWVLMDVRSYEQVEIEKSALGEQERYLREGLEVNVLFWGERPLLVELPPKMEFAVVQTDPGVKGNTVSNLYKGARLENGMTVKVPLFIEEGERVVVDTRDGSYVERMK